MLLRRFEYLRAATTEGDSSLIVTPAGMTGTFLVVGDVSRGKDEADAFWSEKKEGSSVDFGDVGCCRVTMGLGLGCFVDGFNGFVADVEEERGTIF